MITTKAVTSKEISDREQKNRRLAYEAAVEGIVLLENRGILPIEPAKSALFGAGAQYTIKGGQRGNVGIRRHRVAGTGVEYCEKSPCGRNYEYYSEDPVLSGKFAAAVTRGVQETSGNFVTIKQFAVNNQEEDRYYVSSDVDERVLREIYLKGFEIAVKEGHPRFVMTAYNKINDVYCANNRELCTDMLRAEWGFCGAVMTDWLSTGEDRADEAEAISSGVNLSGPDFLSRKDKIVAALEHQISHGDLDRMAAFRRNKRTL